MRLIAAASLALIAATGARADEFAPAMQAYYESAIAAWVNDPVIVSAIESQNARTAGLSQAEIDAMDQAWRAEVGAVDRPTIQPVLDNDAAAFLRARIGDSGGVITEAFVMDARGLNVAASDATSDYWQGDEDKYSKTYAVGPGSIHLGDVEFDESSQSYQGQISATIIDPATGEAIGAMTIGVNAEALM